MAGQLIQRGEKTWLLRVFLGRDEAGRRKYHNQTVRGTKKQAQAELNKLLHQQDTGTFVEPSRDTVRGYLRRWLDSAAKGKVRGRTLHDYESLIRRYLEPAFGDRKLSALTAVEIQALYTRMQLPKPEGMGLSARTVRYAHAVLRSALSQAVRWRLLAHNPATLVELPRQQRREMDVLTPEQAGRFLAAAKEDRYSALWNLLVTTGLRPGEALALRWTDLDGERVRVQRTLVRRAGIGWTIEEPKTSRSRRSVTLPPSTVRALAAHRAKQAEDKLRAGPAYEDQGLIFAAVNGKPLDQQNLVSRHFKPLLKAAGLPTTLRMYDLRHTSATLCLAAGENPKVVSERLGHSTITLTMDTYSHVLPDMQERTAAKLEGMLFGSG